MSMMMLGQKTLQPCLLGTCCFQNPTKFPDVLTTDSKTIIILAPDFPFACLLPVTFGLPCLSEGRCGWAVCVDPVRFQET